MCFLLRLDAFLRMEQLSRPMGILRFCSDYLFFRNNYPEFQKLRAKLTPSPGEGIAILYEGAFCFSAGFLLATPAAAAMIPIPIPSPPLF